MRGALRKSVFTLLLGILSTLALTVHDYAAETRFSSNFTDLTKDCQDALKEVGEGQDMPLKCRGYGGYYIYISYSAFASHITIRTVDGNDNIDLAEESLNYSDKKGNKIEWRFADGKPFAVILKISKYNEKVINNLFGTPYQEKNKTGELLIIKGLKGYEHIDFEVNVITTTDAITKARELADETYLKESS
jgi:hypothetical protein